MMDKQRFSVVYEKFTSKDIIPKGIMDNKKNNHMCRIEEVCDLLNEQQATIITLKRRLEKINGGYGHLTHRNGLTANEWLIESQERELKKKNEQISDWIERHSKDIVKIGEQQATINHLKQELEEYKENWDDMVELATKTSLRNVELDEQIGQLRKELGDCEKFRYTVFKRLNDEHIKECSIK